MTAPEVGPATIRCWNTNTRIAAAMISPNGSWKAAYGAAAVPIHLATAADLALVR